MANMNFDPTSIQPQAFVGSLDPFEPGRYSLHIIESNVTDLKSGNGQGLSLTIEVTEGPNKGRRLWENFNILHNKQQTQEIAQRQLAALCAAADITHTISDSSELHYHPFEAEVEIEPENGMNPNTGRPYPAKNKIKRYIIGDGPPAAKAAPRQPTPPRPAPQPAVAQPARPAAPASTRPWEKKKADDAGPFDTPF